MTDDIIKKLEAIGLGMRVTFVPFSRSRNKVETHKSLNWYVTVTINGRDVVTVPYNAGIAHCPGYGKAVHAAYNWPVRMWQDAICGHEVETGFEAMWFCGGFVSRRVDGEKIQILPKLADVMYSLTMDSDVLRYANFDEWADECGYDTDSRKAEATYQDCLKVALSLNRALGAQGLAYLEQVFEGY